MNQQPSAVQTSQKRGAGSAGRPNAPLGGEAAYEGRGAAAGGELRQAAGAACGEAVP